jgi:hypothetical protein
VQEQRDRLRIRPTDDDERKERDGRNREQEPSANPLRPEDLAHEPTLECLPGIVGAHIAVFITCG